MKKGIALLVAALVLTGILTACGGNENAAGTSSIPQSDTVSVSGETSSEASSSEEPAAALNITVKVERDGETLLTKSYSAEAGSAEDLIAANAEELGATLADSDYGKFVSGMNGYLADDSQKEYWAFLVNGEMSQTGLRDTALSDGMEITFRLDTY